MFLLLEILFKLHICLMCTLSDISWSKRFLTVFLEAKVVPSRIRIWLDTMFLSKNVCYVFE